MYRKKTVVALVMCAAMALIAAAPLAQSAEPGLHTIVKDENGPPSTCAEYWDLTPSEDGTWYGHIVNSGMRWLIIDVVETEGGALLIDREMYRFAALGNTVDTEVVPMEAGHMYRITATPNGPLDSSCTVEDVFEAIVEPEPPVALMSVTLDYLEVSVDGSASYDNDGTIVSYEWDFGDSATASGMTATHAYAADGTYTITLTVTDDDGLTGTTSEPVTVEHELIPPVADFTADVDGLEVSVHAGASYDPDGAIASYDWDFGDGATDSGKTVTHTYAADGTYTITLTVTDDDGLTGTTSEPVTVEIVLIQPVASFTVGVDGLEVSVDGSASHDDDGTIVSFEWDFGDGSTASGMTATHAYAADGTYTITLTVTDDDGLTGTTSEPVTVAHEPIPPVALFSVTVDYLEVSVDGSASYDNDGSIVSYEWDFGDSATASGMTATHAYAADGTYTITLTVTDDDGLNGIASEPVTVEEVVLVPPVVDFTITVDGLTVMVDASDSYDLDGEIVSWDWDFGDGSVGEGETATHAYDPPVDDGTYGMMGVVLGVPPPSYVIWGFTKDSVGTALPFTTVTVTNVDKGTTGTVTSDAAGIYNCELVNVLGEPYYEDGDEILIEAVNGALSGSVTHIVDTSNPVNMVDVVLEGSGGPITWDVTITLTVTDDDGLTTTLSKTVTLTYDP